MLENISLTPHFELRELIASQKAREHGIVNVPGPEEVENLKRLCEGCLEPLREAIELPVIVTSGFRTKALNDKLAHASSTSQHMRGEAADFYVAQAQVSGFKIQDSSDRERLIKAFRLILTSPEIDFDQVILYPTFIHVSYVSKERNRHGILKAQGNGKLGYGRLTRENALKVV